jgi:hypothetical protein
MLARTAERKARQAGQAIPAAAIAVRQEAPAARMAPAGLAPGRPEVDGARLLEQVGLFMTDYAAFPSAAAAVAAVLWAGHERARDASQHLIWRATPRLLLTSEGPGSGKSTVLDLLGILGKSRAGRVGNVTAPGITYLLGRLQEAAYLDDAQQTFGAGARAEKVRQVVNANTRKASALTGAGGKASLTPCYGAVAMAGLDSLIHGTGDRLYDTLTRCIIIRMRPPARRMPELDERGDARGERLADALTAWCEASRDDFRRRALELADLAAAGEDGLDGLGDGGRTAHVWRPLLAVADVAGGQWPAAARAALWELSGAAGDLLAAADTVADLDEADSRSFFDMASAL